MPRKKTSPVPSRMAIRARRRVRRENKKARAEAGRLRAVTPKSQWHTIPMPSRLRGNATARIAFEQGV